MKNLVKMMMVVAALVVLGVGQVWAYPISVNEEGRALQIKLEQSTTKATNGDFGVKQFGTLIPDFTTFCLENDVTFSYNGTYYGTIDNQVLRSGGNKDLYGGTKYLYWNFVQGTLDGWSLTKESVEDLQTSIWALQHKHSGYGNSVTLNDKATYFFNLAETHAEAGKHLNVKAMNLFTSNGGYVQSQLIAPVPEPGTLLLLGSGLAGLALYRRRTRS